MGTPPLLNTTPLKSHHFGVPRCSLSGLNHLPTPDHKKPNPADGTSLGSSQHIASNQINSRARKTKKNPKDLPSLKLTANSPENKPSQKEISIPTIHFQVRKC